MTSRAESAALTRERIIEAMRERFASTPYERIRLEDVAGDSGVTSQTVIRAFGGKAALMTATVERELGRIVAAREAASGAAPGETIAALARHYERYGALIVKMYAEAPLVEGLPALAARGREYHVDWCRRTFGPAIRTADEATRRRRLAQVVAVCDATTWRILRESGLDADETGRAIAELLAPLLRSATD